MRKILVTGGSAVAGDGLKSVVSKGEFSGDKFIFPTSKELNLLNLEKTIDFVKDYYKPDAIIHFAAISGGLQLYEVHPASVMRDNIRMNFNIVEAARLANVPKILLTSSAAAYPLNIPVPMKEEFFHEGYPHEPNYSYAFAKRLIDPIIKSYNKEYGMNIVGVIPGAIIGPRSNFNKNSSTAIPGMIRRFYEEKDIKEFLTIWGDGSPIRQFTSDEDIGRVAMWFINNYRGDKILNISTPEETSIKDAAYIIADSMNIEKNRLIFDTTKIKGTPSQSLDSSKFLGISGFKYSPARETIKRAVEYFIENYPNPEKLRL
jgi:GDP-L-fucose synthase